MLVERCLLTFVWLRPAVIPTFVLLPWSKQDHLAPHSNTAGDTDVPLQVADALLDRRMLAWAKVFASRAAATDWGHATRAENMHAALLSLPPNVLTATLHQFVHEIGPPEALKRMPATLHPFIVAAMISSDGHIGYPYCHEDIFMTQLRSLPNCGHPPLQALLLDGLVLTQSTCYVLHDILANNSRISHLHFDLPRKNATFFQVMKILCPSLAAAPGLSELTITNADQFAPVAALSPLAEALPSLTALERLSIAELDCCKPAEACTTGLPSLAVAEQQRTCWSHFLNAVASHPCLTSLTMTLVHAFEPLPWPDAFPRLEQLSLTFATGCIGGGVLQRAVAAPFSERMPLTGGMRLHPHSHQSSGLCCLVTRCTRSAPVPMLQLLNCSGCGLASRTCECGVIGVDTVGTD